MPKHVRPARQIGRSLVPDVRKPFVTKRFLCLLLLSPEVESGVVLWRDLRRHLLLLDGRGIRSFRDLDPMLPWSREAKDRFVGRRWRHNLSSTACQLKNPVGTYLGVRVFIILLEYLLKCSQVEIDVLF